MYLNKTTLRRDKIINFYLPSRQLYFYAIFLAISLTIISAIELNCVSGSENSTCVVEHIKITKKGENIKKVNFLNVNELLIYDKTVNFLPANFGEKIPALTSLRVQLSKLKEVSKNNFAALNKLKTLDLWNNELKKIPADTFEELRLLEDLNLGDNKIITLEKKTFSNLLNLKILNLESNNLEEIDDHTFIYNRQLEIILLQENYLTSIPTLMLKNVKKLKKLNLDKNEIVSLQDRLFENTRELETLSVANNLIEFIGQTNIKVIMNLTEHDFQYNPCTDSLSNGYSLENLQKIIINSCSVDEKTRVQWLEQEVFSLKRFKREGEKELECYKADALRTEDNLNETRTYLASLISKPSYSKSDLSIETLKTELSAIVKENKVSFDYNEISSAVQEKLKEDFEAIPKKVQTITKEDMKAASADTEIKIKEHIQIVDTSVQSKIKESLEAVTTALSESFNSLKNEQSAMQSALIGKFDDISTSNKEMNNDLIATPEKVHALFDIDFKNIPENVQNKVKDDLEILGTKIIHDLKQQLKIAQESLKTNIEEISETIKQEVKSLKDMKSTIDEPIGVTKDVTNKYENCDFADLLDSFKGDLMDELETDDYKDFVNKIVNLGLLIKSKSGEVKFKFVDQFKNLLNDCETDGVKIKYEDKFKKCGVIFED